MGGADQGASGIQASSARRRRTCRLERLHDGDIAAMRCAGVHEPGVAIR